MQHYLKWNKNAYNRMQLCNRAAGFTSNREDLKSLSPRHWKDLQRVQKVDLKIILQNIYTSYRNDLRQLNLQTLDKRREELYIKFAIIFLKNGKVRNLFPKKKSKRRMRKRKLFKTNTQRYKQAGAELCQTKVKLGYPTRLGASRWRTGRNYGMSNDTFFL